MSDRPTNEYLRFEETWEPEKRKTASVGVYSKSTLDYLGTIHWFGRWRQYCFTPAPHCTFNKGCMTTIIEYIDSLMAERRG